MEIKLVVRILTFNHEKYISKCLDSIINQKVNFKFKVIIGEDCSTDNTALICREYQEKYPDIFELHCNEQNNLYLNSLNNWNQCVKTRAKYIALLEGDDYWTDPQKLQKQVDVLEANPEVTVVCHDAIVVDSQGNLISESAYAYPEHKRDFSSNELMKCTGNILTPTMCFRNVISNFPIEMKNAFFVDTFLTSLLGQHGSSKFLPEKMAAYRKTETGVYSGAKISDRLGNSVGTYMQLSKYYQRLGNKELNKHFISAAEQQNRQHIYYSVLERNKKQLNKALRNNLRLTKEHPDKLTFFVLLKTLIKYNIS